MSSHHFVKEGQEPAIFIVNGFSLSHIESLLEWSPFILVLDTALDDVLNWGIKVDAVLVKQENIDSIVDKTRAQAPVKIFFYEGDAISAGINYLKPDQKSVNIITNINDHVFEVVGNQTSIIILLFDDKIKWISTKKFEKWLNSDTELILKGTTANQRFSVNGLIKLEDKPLISVSDGQVSIMSDDYFWIGESIR